MVGVLHCSLCYYLEIGSLTKSEACYCNYSERLESPCFPFPSVWLQTCLDITAFSTGPWDLNSSLMLSAWAFLATKSSQTLKDITSWQTNIRVLLTDTAQGQTLTECLLSPSTCSFRAIEKTVESPIVLDSHSSLGLTSFRQNESDFLPSYLHAESTRKWNWSHPWNRKAWKQTCFF